MNPCRYLACRTKNTFVLCWDFILQSLQISLWISQQEHKCIINKFRKKTIINPLTLMGVVAPGSAHARPSARPPIDMSGNFPPHVCAESSSNISRIYSSMLQYHNICICKRLTNCLIKTLLFRILYCWQFLWSLIGILVRIKYF